MISYSYTIIPVWQHNISCLHWPHQSNTSSHQTKICHTSRPQSVPVHTDRTILNGHMIQYPCCISTKLACGIGRASSFRMLNWVQYQGYYTKHTNTVTGWYWYRIQYRDNKLCINHSSKMQWGRESVKSAEFKK